MKKLFLFVAILILGQTAVFAQKEVSVKETAVPVRYVKDFNNQAKDAQNASWVMTADSSTYMVTFTNNDGDRQSIRFTSKSTEKRYYVESQYYPHAILDTVKTSYPKYKIKDLYIRDLKGKMTYQCRIAKTKGFLFWRKEADAKLISFETNGKMIEVIDEQ